MKRSEFISSLSGHARAQQYNHSPDVYSRMPAFDPAGLKRQYHEWLFSDFIPSMDKYVVDHELGGFMCSVDIETGKQGASSKSAWFEGRGLWTYSFLYNKIKKDPAFLMIARKSKDFILKHQPSGGEFWTSSFTREGKPASGPGDIYSSLFVAEGLAEYSLAAGDNSAFELARSIVLSCMDRYNRPDYRYKVTYLRADSPEIPAPRVLGHWMIFLRSLTQLMEVRPDNELAALLDTTLEAILEKHLNKSTGLFNEVLNHDFSTPDSDFARFAYTGHGIETCWMLMAEANRRKDGKLFDRCADLFRFHVEVAEDEVYGGYFRSLDDTEMNVWKTDKVLWLQEEILIGTMMMIEKRKDAWAMGVFEKTLDYVKGKFIRPGYKFWISAGDRRVGTFQRVRAEHYHHPRHLMLNLLSLQRMT